MHNKKLFLVLMLASLLCVALVTVRFCITGYLRYFFLIWNLMLAWIPYLLAMQLEKSDEGKKTNWKLWVLFFAWLLFFPNAPYILTDLFHLKQRPMIPIWFDLALIASFAWNGLMLGFISLLTVQDFLKKRFGSSFSYIAVILILFLCGFGIYLGRYERWNSWDLLTDPLALMNDVGTRFLHPMKHPRTIGVTALFSAFLLVNYAILFVMAKPHNQAVEKRIN